MSPTVPSVRLASDSALVGSPHRALGPGNGLTGLQFDHGGMLRLVLIEIGKRAAGEGQASRLNRILVGHDDERSVCDREVRLRGAFHPMCEVGQRLRREWEVLRVLEVRGELAWEHFVKSVPGVSGPSRAEPPFGQRLVQDKASVPPFGDDRRSLNGAVEGRGNNGRVIR